jgi:hypothetical protein
LVSSHLRDTLRQHGDDALVGKVDHIPDEDWDTVGRESRAVVQQAKDAGVWLFGGGINEDIDPVMVAGDGTTTDETYPQTRKLDGGFTVIEAPTRDVAEFWAAKIAVACRCSQELREFMYDPES